MRLCGLSDAGCFGEQQGAGNLSERRSDLTEIRLAKTRINSCKNIYKIECNFLKKVDQLDERYILSQKLSIELMLLKNVILLNINLLSPLKL